MASVNVGGPRDLHDKPQYSRKIEHIIVLVLVDVDLAFLRNNDDYSEKAIETSNDCGLITWR